MKRFLKRAAKPPEEMSMAKRKFKFDRTDGRPVTKTPDGRLFVAAAPINLKIASRARVMVRTGVSTGNFPYVAVAVNAPAGVGLVDGVKLGVGEVVVEVFNGTGTDFFVGAGEPLVKFAVIDCSELEAEN